MNRPLYIKDLEPEAQQKAIKQFRQEMQEDAKVIRLMDSLLWNFTPSGVRVFTKK